MEQLFEWAFRIKADADHKLAVMKKNSTKGFQDLAALDGEQAAYLKGIDPRPGADGPEKRLAERFENSRNMWLAMATDGRHPIPTTRPEHLAEMEADALCMQAIAPWLELSVEEQEKRYREAVRVCNWSAYAHRSLGRHLWLVGRVEEAIHHLRRSIELNPANEEGREALAVVHAERSEYQDVLALTAGKVSSTMLRAVRAHALLKSGDVAGAENLSRIVLDEHPRQTVALRVLADCLRASGERRKAHELEMRADLFERGVQPPGA